VRERRSNAGCSFSGDQSGNRQLFRLFKGNVRQQRTQHNQLLWNPKHEYYKPNIVFARVQAPPRFLGQEFGNNNNSYFSRTGFCLCESTMFPITFAVLWLSLAAFTVICQ
jgi:hypothetical protein